MKEKTWSIVENTGEEELVTHFRIDDGRVIHFSMSRIEEAAGGFESIRPLLQSGEFDIPKIEQLQRDAATHGDWNTLIAGATAMEAVNNLIPEELKK